MKFCAGAFAAALAAFVAVVVSCNDTFVVVLVFSIALHML